MSPQDVSLAGGAEGLLETRSGVPAGVPTGVPGPSRVVWIDYARGLAIILVVYGHCFRGLLDAGDVAANSPLRMVDFTVYGFHMPLFFFLSGAVSTKAFQQGLMPFLRSRLMSIGWPYLLWMSVEAALLISLSGLTNMGPPHLGIDTYLYRPLSPFWFLYALFAASLVVYALRRLPPPIRLGIAASLSIVGQMIPVDIVQLASWGLFYLCLGHCCALWIKRPQVIARLSAPGVVVAMAAATIAISLAFLRLGCAYRYEVPVALFGSATVFGCAEQLAKAARRLPALQVIAVLGQISLTILVVHVLGTAGMRIALTKVLHLHVLWLHLLAGTTAGLALPLCLQLGSERLGLLRPLGLPARPAWRRGG